MNIADLWPQLVAGLLPVLLFLAGLLYLDSNKLVRSAVVLACLVAGGLSAGVSFLLNDLLIPRLGLEAVSYTRYVAPFVEELVKATFLLHLIRTHRVGFLIDAAILGFAIGSGFAIVENLYYLQVRPESGMAVWVIRGFGTAVMHGGATCLFGIITQATTERHPRWPLTFVPGLVVAAALHSLYNHFFFSPVLGAFAILGVFPPLLRFVFLRTERSLARWLDVGFDADAELLELIQSGRLSDSKVGRYLQSLREKFRDEVVADLICYLRIQMELSLQAKGRLLARQSGFAIPIDDETTAKLAELAYLERSIGRTGRLAMAPFLRVGGRHHWQRHLLRG